MSPLFTLESLFADSTLGDSLSIRKLSNNRSLIIRLLAGGVTIKHAILPPVNQDSCLFSEKNPEYKASYIPSELPTLISEDLSYRDLSSYLNARNWKHRNKDFFLVFFNEICMSILSANSGHYTSSFINLYRNLEKISYALPMIYATSSNSYDSTFKNLKSFFIGANDKSGELKFFDKFIAEISKNANLDSLSITIRTEKFFENIDSQIFNTREDELEVVAVNFGNIIKKIGGDRVSLTTPTEIEVKFKHFASLMIDIRNKYAHNLSDGDQNNIQAHEITYPEWFFECLISPFIYWYSLIFLEVIKNDISHYQDTISKESNINKNKVRRKISTKKY